MTTNGNTPMHTDAFSMLVLQFVVLRNNMSFEPYSINAIPASIEETVELLLSGSLSQVMMMIREREMLSVQNTSGYSKMNLLIIALTSCPCCKAQGN